MILSWINIDKTGLVKVERPNISEDIIDELESSLMIYYTHTSRSTSEILKEHTLTASYLNGEREIEVPKQRREGNGKSMKLTGATGNNLKNVSIEIP